jgi:prolipoprotein diacylglyceryltransferase
LVRLTGRVRAPGLFALYVAGYSAFRIFAELIRVDPAKHIFGLRLNLFVAVTLCVAGLVWFWRTQRQSAAGGSFSGSPGSGASSGSSSAGGPSG